MSRLPKVHSFSPEAQPADSKGSALVDVTAAFLGAFFDLLRQSRRLLWRRSFSNTGPVSAGTPPTASDRKTSNPGSTTDADPVRLCAESASFRPFAELPSFRRVHLIDIGFSAPGLKTPSTLPVSPDGLSALPTPVCHSADHQPKASTFDGKRILSPCLSPPARQSFGRPQPQSSAKEFYPGILLWRKPQSSASSRWTAYSAAA